MHNWMESEATNIMANMFVNIFNTFLIMKFIVPLNLKCIRKGPDIYVIDGFGGGLASNRQ